MIQTVTKTESFEQKVERWTAFYQKKGNVPIGGYLETYAGILTMDKTAPIAAMQAEQEIEIDAQMTALRELMWSAGIEYDDETLFAQYEERKRNWDRIAAIEAGETENLTPLFPRRWNSADDFFAGLPSINQEHVNRAIAETEIFGRKVRVCAVVEI